MATVNLGSIKFKWKGTYSGATAYTIDDVVEYNGSSYICILASTGNLPTNATYFEQMSSAGTNGTDGTDLGTTLTTQGDIVYRDASGLARLGAGTNGQVLQTGGTGANPSWTTVSSDVVRLFSTTVNETSDVIASITMNNIFDDTIYHSYKMFISGVNSNSNAFRLVLQGLDTSGSVLSNGHYSITHDTAYHNSGSSTHNGNGFREWNGGSIRFSNWDTSQLGQTGTENYVVTFHAPTLNTNAKFFNWHGNNFDSASPWHVLNIGSGFIQHNNMTGFQLTGNGFYFRQANVQIYGFKK